MLLAPLISFDEISLREMNDALVAWDHKMGPLKRPGMEPWFFGLREHERLIGVAAGSRLIAPTAAGLTRMQAMELSRVCAVEPDWCRVVLRLWRNAVFPGLCKVHGYEYAVSYQDADKHTGNLYRFDGWTRVEFSHSGTDERSGRQGRDKWIWLWHSDKIVRRGFAEKRKVEKEGAKRKNARIIEIATNSGARQEVLL